MEHVVTHVLGLLLSPVSHAVELLGEGDATLGFPALEEMGLLRQMVKQPGQKECRFVHLLAKEPESSIAGYDALPDDANPQGSSRKDRIAELEDEVGSLREELEELKQDLFAFKQQFE